MTPAAALFIRTLASEQVDLLGLPKGGFVAGVITEEEPHLVRKVILAGTGPSRGPASTRSRHSPSRPHSRAP